MIDSNRLNVQSGCVINVERGGQACKVYILNKLKFYSHVSTSPLQL